jgi:hypothetical protein
MTERIHVLRAPEVAQSMHPEINEPHAVRQVLGDQVVHRPREQRLAAVSDRAQPGAPV